MKNFIVIITILVLAFSIFVLFMQTNIKEASTAEVIKNAFEITGADIVSSEVYIHGTVAAENLAYEDGCERLSTDIILGCGGDAANTVPVFNSIDTDISCGTETNYIIDDNRRILISILRDMLKSAHEAYYLTISLVDVSPEPALSESIAGIDRVLEKYNVAHEANISLVGSLNGQMEDWELENLCSRVFESIRADRVEGIKDDGLISVSAFSPVIKDAISVDGKRVNVNLASRYNSYEGKTYIWLATPVITTEY